MHQQYIWPSIAVITIGIFILLGYTSRWFEWIGLRGFKKIGITTEIAPTPQQIIRTEEDQPRKTLWDWLQLLIIPAVLVGATLFFNNAQVQNSNKLINQQHEADINLLQNQQWEDALINYEKDISDLLPNQQLGSSSFRAVARARTLAALSILDRDRKGLLIQFLYDTRLITTRHPIVDLSNANLIEVNLKLTKLSRVNLSGAILSGSDLSGADLSGAYLIGVDLEETGHIATNLSGTNLSGAYLWNANLHGVDLRNTRLSESEPNGTYLRADLSGATLLGAKVDVNKLQKARLSNTIMPDKTLNTADTSACHTSSSDLSDDISKWTIFLPTIQKAQADLSQVIDPKVINSNVDDNAMQISFLGGDPYTNVGAAYHLSPNKTVQAIELSMCFYLIDLTPAHAIKFSVNRWVGNQRYELALQWEAYDDVNPQHGTPRWRLWTGKNWQDIPVPTGQQDLTQGQWYWLDLVGKIANGRVHYESISLNDVAMIQGPALGMAYNPGFLPVPTQSQDGLDVGVQLSSNTSGEPYDIYVDRVNLKI